MSDDKIIDITNVKALKDRDQNITPQNFRSKMEFVNAANELIGKIIGKSDFEFFQVFKSSLPEEVLDDFKYRSSRFRSGGFDSTVIEDLNILSQIERMLGLNSVVFSPTCTDANLTGWIAGFNMADCMFSSPEMNTEAKARAFSILLFLRLRDVLRA